MFFLLALCLSNKKKKKSLVSISDVLAKMVLPGFEPETFSVLDWRDNQLHHETFPM